MKAKTATRLVITGIIALGLGFWAGRGTAGSHAGHAGHSHSEPAQSGPSVWTCSMHPQIQQDGPGDCPICGMDLIPLEADAADESGPRSLTISESAKSLARIVTSEVQRVIPEVEVRMTGKIEIDRTQLRSLAARFPGRIDRLFVNFEGTRVEKGEHLATIYSPELLTAQAELLQATQFDPNGRAAQAAREKLRLWDLPQQEIEAIVQRGTPSDRITIYAPAGGVVTAKNVSEGDYVQTGQTLFSITDLSQLWLNLDAYETDIAWIRLGQQVQFHVTAYPGRTFEGTVAFVEPYLDETTRTVNVRVNVENKEGLLKPGMLARGILQPKAGADGVVFADQLAGKYISPMHPWIVRDEPGQCDVCGMDLVPASALGYEAEPLNGEPPLVVPASAVLRTGKRAVVYVEDPNAERPTYEGREIILGPRTSGGFIVLGGLEAGERVVTHGAFKIDSSLQIQAKPSMMSPGEAQTETASAPAHLKLTTEVAGKILPSYIALQEALTGDDLQGALNALKEMMAVTGHSGALPDLIHRMLAANSLDAIRRPHFEDLSNAVIAAIEISNASIGAGLYMMHCPMVYNDRGANWIQASESVSNPYFGASMLRCGEVVKSWAE